ncbi:homeoprotein [Apiospora marii]|uniref:homeoprotein n=1 Tax=Apiospora marii TaxID=335849 RepID=UPI00312E6A10
MTPSNRIKPRATLKTYGRTGNVQEKKVQNGLGERSVKPRKTFSETVRSVLEAEWKADPKTRDYEAIQKKLDCDVSKVRLSAWFSRKRWREKHRTPKSATSQIAGSEQVLPSIEQHRLSPNLPADGHLSCSLIRIGTWFQDGTDLAICSLKKRHMSYAMKYQKTWYTMQYPFASITRWATNPRRIGCAGGLVVEINRPPSFFVAPEDDNLCQRPCDDFTCGQQASRLLTHLLDGNPDLLVAQFMDLTGLRPSPGQQPDDIGSEPSLGLDAQEDASGIDTRESRNMRGTQHEVIVKSANPDREMPEIDLDGERSWKSKGHDMSPCPSPGCEECRGGSPASPP